MAFLLDMTVYYMLGLSNIAGMIVSALVIELLSGVVIGLPPMCFCILTEAKSRISTRIRQEFSVAGLELLNGGPSVGAIFGTQPRNWNGFWVYGGTAGVTGAFILGIIQFLIAGFNLNIEPGVDY